MDNISGVTVIGIESFKSEEDIPKGEMFFISSAYNYRVFVRNDDGINNCFENKVGLVERGITLQEFVDAATKELRVWIDGFGYPIKEED